MPSHSSAGQQDDSKLVHSEGTQSTGVRLVYHVMLFCLHMAALLHRYINVMLQSLGHGCLVQLASGNSQTAA